MKNKLNSWSSLTWPFSKSAVSVPLKNYYNNIIYKFLSLLSDSSLCSWVPFCSCLLPNLAFPVNRNKQSPYQIGWLNYKLKVYNLAQNKIRSKKEVSSNQEKFIWTILKHRVTIPLRLLKYMNFKNITHVAAFNLIYKWVISFYPSYLETTKQFLSKYQWQSIISNWRIEFRWFLTTKNVNYVLVENNT